MKNILFVDDETYILTALRRTFRKMSGEWNMLFAASGQDALAVMRQYPIDVIVTDMRMPQMDGAQLLTEVVKQYPNTVRIILSGHSEMQLVLKSATTAHQFLTKPCDMNELKSTINRVFELQKLLNNDELLNMVSHLNTLPSMPSVYQELTELMRDPLSTMEQVGDVISKDIAMSAKILQLVNSAFFGIPRHISSPAEAATFLGIEVMRGLVSSFAVFDALNEDLDARFDLEAISKRGLIVAVAAKAIAKVENQSPVIRDHAFIAGLMHDIGKLVLAVNRPDRYSEVLDVMASTNRPDYVVEEQIFGQSHMAIGAYLLGLWSMPNSVVEAVAFHHRPEQCASQHFIPLIALYGALALVEESSEHSPKHYPIGVLEKLGIDEGKIAQWRETCQSLLLNQAA